MQPREFSSSVGTRLMSRLDRIALGPVRSVARSSASLLQEETERVIDGVLAGPLPEAVARSIVEHQVVQRVVTEVLESTAADDATADQIEALVERVLRSPSLERWAASGEAAQLVEPIVDRVLRSDAFKQTMVGIIGSPELRRALSNQTAGYGSELASAARSRAERGGDVVESRVHRWLHVRRSEAEQSAYAGFGTRAVGLIVDIALAYLAFLLVELAVVLVGMLVGASRSG